MKPPFILAIFALIFISCEEAPNFNHCADELFKAHVKHEPLPSASNCTDSMSRELAYEIQKSYASLIEQKDSVLGFKAALTSEAARQRLGATEPVSGVLFYSGRIDAREGVEMSHFLNPLIETELGYHLNKTLEDTVSSSELRGLIASVLPVIELPDAAYAAGLDIKPEDFIAANSGSSHFILGRAVEYDAIDLNSLPGALHLNDSIVNEGLGWDAMGDQLEALKWLVNNIISQGYVIEPGHLLITGSLGKAMPLQQGNYTAHYGSGLGSLYFEVK